MDQKRHKRIYALHSWSGITLGLFVYIVAFTGCFALFDHEIQTWEDPAIRLPLADPPAPINTIFLNWISDNLSEEEKVGSVNFRFPNQFEPYYRGFLVVETLREDGGHDRRFISQRWDTQSGAPLSERGDGAAHWLLDFHRQLMWPDSLGGTTIGRGLVGVAGVILLLSIISGVMAHTKIFQELFTLRFFRSMRLKWQDTHKVLGLWGLPFYAMIAFTGAVIGIVTLLAPITALLTFKGDQEALVAAVIGTSQTAPAGIEAPMISIDELALITEPKSGAPITTVQINNWGDQNARFTLLFKADTELASVDSYQINGVTGEPTHNGSRENLSAANRTLGAMTPLHYGTYGGVALKIVYFLLGLSLAIITALGMMMWLERRLHGNEGARPQWFYQTLSKVTVGTTCGLAIATASILYVDRLAPATGEGRIILVGWSYFAIWAAGIFYPFIRKDDYRAATEMIAATGLLFAALPLLNFATTGDFFIVDLFPNTQPYAWVDLFSFIFGAATIISAMALPKERKTKSASRQHATKLAAKHTG